MAFVNYGKYRNDSIPNCGEIFAIYVLADYYNQKIGYKLMNAAFLELSNYKNLAVWVFKGNERAI
ncbi:MAG: GNAT family N-acetyltransferase [Erysipelotrichaceae bacterium]|nr:GNAT family N-acetyltransferase [Erysipelotrichaceae bacterium]